MKKWLILIFVGLFLVSFGSAAVFNNDLDNGLEHYWNFDGDFEDSVGGIQGVGNGTLEVVEGIKGQAYYLNNLGDHIDIGKPELLGNNNLTLSIWFKAVNDSKKRILYERGRYLQGYQIYVINGKLGIEVCGSRGSIGDETMNPQTNLGVVGGDGEWHNVVLELPSSGVVGWYVYVDGELKSYDDAHIGGLIIDASVERARIGEYQNSPVRDYPAPNLQSVVNKNWYGRVDELGIWNRILTAEEVGLLYRFYIPDTECTVFSDCPDDENICTTNTCTYGSCGVVNNQDSCDDGLWCTLEGSCSEGDCVVGTPRVCPSHELSCAVASCAEDQDSCIYDFSACSCINNSDCPDDGNTCTSPACNLGYCSVSPLNVSCDDSNLCTGNDWCSNSTCVGLPVSVDDGNPLTYDSCLANGTILHRTFLASGDGDSSLSGDGGDSTGDGDSDPVENETLNNSGTNTSGTGSASSGTDDESSLWWVWILSGVVLIGLIVGGVFGWKAYQKKKEAPVVNEGVVQQQRNQMMSRRPMPPRR
jgi:hypothetical protein